MATSKSTRKKNTQIQNKYADKFNSRGEKREAANRKRASKAQRVVKATHKGLAK